MPVNPKRTKIYDNDRVLHPNGSLLFYCNRRKSNWYLERQLANLISKDPFTIQLGFEPGGPGQQKDNFYFQVRDNICVVCGTSEKLNKHHVVPHCYRKFLHVQKIHSSHDILPICTKDHEKYEILADQLKLEIANEYNVPLDGIIRNRLQVLNQRDGRSAARTLLKYGKEIPEHRKQFLLDRIYSAFNKDLSLEDISKIDIECDTITHGSLVVERLTDIQSFIERWRLHFVTEMQPKFLPPHWDVKRK